MTSSIPTVNTVPFCGACGWDVTLAGDLSSDLICDACGADLRAYGFLPPPPAPTDLAAVGGSLVVTFTWTEVVDTTYDFEHQIEAETPVVTVGATSPWAIVAAAGEEVTGRVRSVVGGFAGPWSDPVSATATA